MPEINFQKTDSELRSEDFRPSLLKAAATVYIKTDDIGEVKRILAENQIAVKSIYRADENEFVKIR